MLGSGGVPGSGGCLHDIPSGDRREKTDSEPGLRSPSSAALSLVEFRPTIKASPSNQQTGKHLSIYQKKYMLSLPAMHYGHLDLSENRSTNQVCTKLYLTFQTVKINFNICTK